MYEIKTFYYSKKDGVAPWIEDEISMLKQVIKYFLPNQENLRKSSGRSSPLKSSRGPTETTSGSLKSTEKSGSTICARLFSRVNGLSMSRSSWCALSTISVENGHWFLESSVVQETSTTLRTNSINSINSTIKAISSRVKPMPKSMNTSWHVCLQKRPRN